MNILDMKNIRKAFGDNEVLKDISLSVSEGQVTAVIGPSGSGKSTLLRCATLLESVDGGSITYLDMEAVREEEGDVLQHLVAAEGLADVFHGKDVHSSAPLQL